MTARAVGRGPGEGWRRHLGAAALVFLPLAFATPAAPVVADAAPGRVAGRVRLADAATGRPLPIGYATRTPTTAAGPVAEIRNVVLYLNGVPPAAVQPSRHVMRQQGESFVPHVLPIVRGSSVEFPNADPYFHNVFSLSRAAAFDLGRYPPGQSRTRRFDRAGLVKVFCHLHAHMSAVIMVLDHPWFDTPADDGGFAIERVPAGRHTVTAWHERVGDSNATVVVPAGGTASVEFLLPVVEEP